MTTTDDAIKATFGHYSIRYALACYALDRNPQHLWTVWRWCRIAGIEVPTIVLKYLDSVADKLDPSSPKFKRKGRIDTWVRDAVLGGSKAPRDTAKHVEIVRRALELSPDLELSAKQRGELLNGLGIDDRTIRRWLKRAREIINRTMADLCE